MSKKWWKCACIRAIRTFAQTMSGMIVTAIFLTDVNWIAVLSASTMAGIASIVTSLANGLPEVDE